MSTKKETTQNTNQAVTFDPKSKASYDALNKASALSLQDMIQNPLTNGLYNLGLGQSQRGAQLAGNQSMNMLLNNMRVSGLSGNSGNAFQQAQTNRIGRSNLSMMSQAHMQNIFQALQRQQQATAMGLSYQPLQTGQTGHSNSTETTSGLGTWLPQMIGAGLGMAGAFATGGASAGSAFTPGKANVGGYSGAPNPMSLTSNSFQPMPNLYTGFSPRMPTLGN